MYWKASPWILWAKNIFYLCVSGVTIYHTWMKSTYMPLMHIIMTYTLLDMFVKNEPDIYVHHLLFITQYVYYILHGDNFDEKGMTDRQSVLSQSMFNSSLFLTIGAMIDQSKWSFGKKIIKPWNDALFIGSFFYYRIYRYIDFLLDHAYHQKMQIYCEDHHWSCLPHFYIIYIGFFMINVYWMNIIGKKLVKMTGLKAWIQKVPTYYTERLLNYTLLGSAVHTGFVYMKNGNNMEYEYWIDVMGLIFLGYMSMYCHHTWEKVFQKRCESIDEIRKWTFLDQLAIKIRSLAIIYAVYGACPVTYLSAWIHLLTYTGFYCYVSRLNKDLDIHTVAHKINMATVFCTGLSFIYDNTMICIYDFHNPFCKYNAILAIFIMGAFYVQPFYEMKQIYVHLLLMIQNYVLAMINITK